MSNPTPPPLSRRDASCAALLSYAASEPAEGDAWARHLAELLGRPDEAADLIRVLRLRAGVEVTT